MSHSLCLVGGASGLIGKEICLFFSKKGYKVYALDKKSTSFEHENITFLHSDLSEESEVKKVFAEIFQNKNYEDVSLVNSQAIASPHVDPLSKLSFKKWKSYFAANVDSVFLTSRELLNYQDSFREASIINFSSTRHFMAEPHTEPYCSTKGAIKSFTMALAQSLSSQTIRVNSVSPGWITDKGDQLEEKHHKQHASGRVGHPRDIAEMCLFLAQKEKSGFITGQDFVIDGGMTTKMIYK